MPSIQATSGTRFPTKLKRSVMQSRYPLEAVLVSSIFVELFGLLHLTLERSQELSAHTHLNALISLRPFFPNHFHGGQVKLQIK